MDKSDIRLFLKLLQPSTMSFIVCMIVACIVVGYLTLSAATQTGIFAEYFALIEQHPSAAYAEYSRLSTEINSNDTMGNASVFVVWSMVGLILYYVGVGLLTMSMGLRHFLEHLSYGNADKGAEWRHVLLGLLLRLLALAGLLLVLRWGVTLFIPGVVVTTSAASDFSVWSAGYVICAALLIVLFLHVCLVLLRLLLLRTRVFFGRYYVEE